MNFTFIRYFNIILINCLKIVFYIHLCGSHEMGVYYETHKSMDSLKDQLPHSEDGISFNSYGLESMPLEIILHMDKTMALLEFDSSGKVLEKCQLFDLEKESDRADSTATTTGLPVITSDFKTMQEAINKCRELTEKLSPLSTQDQTSANITADSSISWFSLWRGLIPGTKWCGLGDTANTYDDLGPKRDIDLCCRAHDHCPIRLKALRFGYGLINLSLYTKSHCECDEDFLKCLKRSSNSYASMLGNFYFNVLKVQCIKEERPVLCVEIRKSSNGKEECARYEVSNDAKMKFVTPELQF